MGPNILMYQYLLFQFVPLIVKILHIKEAHILIIQPSCGLFFVVLLMYVIQDKTRIKKFNFTCVFLNKISNIIQKFYNDMFEVAVHIFKL